jgi:hypothetical protein
MEISTRDALTVTAPKGLIVVNGHPRVRRAAFVIQPRELTCIDGHRIHERARISEDGYVWCTHKERAGAVECGAMLWILVVPQRGERRKFFAADVTADEMRDWERRHLEVDDILRILGVTFPNAA